MIRKNSSFWYKAQAIARWHKRVHGTDLDVENLYMQLVERRARAQRMRDGTEEYAPRSRYIVSV